MSSENDNIDYKETFNVTRAHSAAAREKNIPTSDENERFPLWALFGFFVVIGTAFTFWGLNKGGLDNMTFINSSYEQQVPGGDEAAGAEEELSPEDAWIKKGKNVYKIKGGCIGCHQATGTGIPGQFPPLAGSEWVIHGDERLIMGLLHGINGPLVVKGNPYNGQMPAVGQTLTDAEIAQVASYIRNEWGNEASLVSEDEVKNAREIHKDQQGSYTQSGLEAVPQDQMVEGADFGS